MNTNYVDIFPDQNFLFESDAKTKKEALIEISNLAFENGIVKNKDFMLKGFLDREAEVSTGLENGIAFPHCQIPQIHKTNIIIIKYKNDIDWESLDNKPTKIAIALLVPKNKANTEQIKLLSALSVKLLKPGLIDKLKEAKKYDEIFDILFSEEKKENEKKDSKKETFELEKKLIIGITACPVGIANTYLAADELKKAAKKS